MVKVIDILDLYNPDVKIEIKVDKDILFELAKEWNYCIFKKETTYSTFYFMLTPNYIFYAREGKSNGNKQSR